MYQFNFRVLQNLIILAKLKVQRRAYLLRCLCLVSGMRYALCSAKVGWASYVAMAARSETRTGFCLLFAVLLAAWRPFVFATELRPDVESKEDGTNDNQEVQGVQVQKYSSLTCNYSDHAEAWLVYTTCS